MKRIKDELGGTVNDVVLAVVAGAIRDWLHARGIRSEGLELRAQVPVSIRAEGERGQLGNRLAVMRAPLPVYIADPGPPPPDGDPGDAGAEAVQAGARRGGDHALQRLRPAHAARAGGADQLLDPPLQPGGDQCARARRCRCTCWVASCEDIFPVGFLPPHQALFVAIMSYNGGVNFGLLADYDSMDDLELIAAGDRALDRRAGRCRGGGRRGARARAGRRRRGRRREPLAGRPLQGAAGVQDPPPEGVAEAAPLAVRLRIRSTLVFLI